MHDSVFKALKVHASMDWNDKLSDHLYKKINAKRRSKEAPTHKLSEFEQLGPVEGRNSSNICIFATVGGNSDGLTRREFAQKFNLTYTPLGLKVHGNDAIITLDLHPSEYPKDIPLPFPVEGLKGLKHEGPWRCQQQVSTGDTVELYLTCWEGTLVGTHLTWAKLCSDNGRLPIQNRTYNFTVTHDEIFQKYYELQIDLKRAGKAHAGGADAGGGGPHAGGPHAGGAREAELVRENERLQQQLADERNEKEVLAGKLTQANQALQRQETLIGRAEDALRVNEILQEQLQLARGKIAQLEAEVQEVHTRNSAAATMAEMASSSSKRQRSDLAEQMRRMRF